MTVERARTWKITAVAVLISVLLRLRMLWSPISVDEGGYLAVARAWAHGQVLYRDVFVDRPQGLLVLFRFWDFVSGGSTGSIRIMAMLFGALLVVSTAIIVRELAGDLAARFAAVICAVVSAAPVLEGFAANAELLSGAVAAAGLAVAALAVSRGRRRWLWFTAAGVLGGLALSLKQSGFDGIVTVAVWLLATIVFCRPDRRTARRSLAMFAVGISTVIAAMMIHGALTGWSRWWSAVVGYRMKTQSAFSAADWHNLAVTAPYAAVTLGAASLVAVQGSVVSLRGIRTKVAESMTAGPWLLIVWAASSAGGFLIGGGFWRHYWLLLVAPVSALAGVGFAALPRPRYPLLAAALIPSLAITAWVYTGSTARLNVRAASDFRAAVDQRVASWFVDHRAPGQNLYVLCASAGVYADAGQDPGYPYLWFVEVHDGAHAQRRLVDYLGDPHRAPSYIAEYQSAWSCDHSGRVAQIIGTSYHKVATVDGIAMLERTSTTSTVSAATTSAEIGGVGFAASGS